MDSLSYEEFCNLFKDGDIFFIQIGANDGITYDPIRELIKKNKWKGIFYEPGNESFGQLKNNYKECSDLIFENKAVSNFDGKGTLYCGSTTMHFTMIEQIANTFFSVKPTTVEVETVSPSSIIKNYNIKKLDLLQIDTEGHDMTIVRAFPFNIIKPRVIRFEYVHLYFEKENEGTAQQFLSQLGYKIYIDTKDGDLIAVLSD